MTKSSLAIALLGVTLAGCTALGPDYVRPGSPVPEDWQSSALKALPVGEKVQADWWRNLADPVLDALIDEALQRNHQVRIAGLRIIEARAQLGIADSTMYPQVQQLSGSALGVDHRVSGGSSSRFMQYDAAFNMGWELDFWGRFRRGIEAADASYLARLAQYDDLQVLMAAQVAEVYVNIRTLEARLKIAQDNAAIQRRSLDITEKLFKSGNDSELDVQQAKTQYLSTVASIPPLEASLRKAQNALSILLARPPGPPPELASDTGRIPEPALGIAVDLPATALLRRPDVRVAEMQLAAQSAQIGIAETELYPSLSLLGSLGLSASSLATPTSTDLGIGPSLKWNVFDYGRLRNAVRVQDARYQQLIEQYQDSVLQAARDVDDSAMAYAKNIEQIALLEQGEQAARRSLDIANIQYREGMADFQRVLDAQRALFSQQERVVSNRGNVVLSLIALYKAMGGGWQSARTRPLLDDATIRAMKARTDWNDMLTAPLPAPPQAQETKQ
ncbi:TolC family protein [Jeongeupia wiesaeckerbachi]|uniref:efflux transporter outer membrane subunit n=1 Tax=Jeongeupia wiesaeckerbachi TaxID=3051218 RepID=UPI003D809962